MFTALRLLRHGLAFFKLVCTCLCGLDHASAVFDGIQTQFTRVITPTLQEHLRSPQKQRWNESKERSHGGVFYAIRPVRLQAKSPSPNVTDKSGIRWICCDFGYFWPDFGRFYLSEEAGAGIEPANSVFADRDLTTWLPRHLCEE